MEDKIIDTRILEIFNLFSQLIVMQIQSLYDEYEELELHEIENDYNESYKNLICESENGVDICSKIKEFILMEIDPYGLDTKGSNIKSDIENIFYDFGRNLSVESMMLRDKWKKNQVGELEENISFLNETIKKLSEVKNILEKDLRDTKNKSDNFKKELDKSEKENEQLIKRLNLSLDELKVSKEKLKKEESKTVKLSKENRNLNVEVQDLKSQNESLAFDKKSLKQENLMLSQKIKTSVTNLNMNEIKKSKAETEHLKNGINLLKSQIKDKDNSMNKILSEKNELKYTLQSKEKEIEKLKKEIDILSKSTNKSKMTAKEVQQAFIEIYRDVFEQLKKIVSTTKNIQGQNTMTLAGEINKIATSLRSLDSTENISQLLSEFISKLSYLHRLLENDVKKSGLNKYIDLLIDIESKI